LPVSSSVSSRFTGSVGGVVRSRSWSQASRTARGARGGAGSAVGAGWAARDVWRRALIADNRSSRVRGELV